MDEYAIFKALGLALMLGLLVGLQRERTAQGRPGVRTFPLITVFGTVCMLLGTWAVVAGMLAVIVIIPLPHYMSYLLKKQDDIGATTDVAALLMFAVGALLGHPEIPPVVSVAIGGGVAVLLQFKPEMHRFVERLGDTDVKAIMQFVLISFIILPILPNRNYGPPGLDVLNPFETWLMVALIVGMSLFGYIIYKFFGRNAGIMLGGFLGGAISSTATTVSYSRQAKGDPLGTRVASIVIMVASTVVFIRVLIEIAVVSPRFLAIAAPPISVLMALTLIPSLILWYRVRNEPSNMPEQSNPTQLKSAITFGILYAVVLFALAAAKQFVGTEGLMVVAALSGLTDMDAITLSTARMADSEPAIMAEGWRLIIVGALANLVFKAGMVAFLGDRRLFRRIVALFALPLIGGIVLLFVWPSQELPPAAKPGAVQAVHQAAE